MANQDLPVLLGPMKTVSGRNSTVASAMGPKSATSSSKPLRGVASSLKIRFSGVNRVASSVDKPAC